MLRHGPCLVVSFGLVAAAGCGAKPPVDDSFADVGDAKSDAFSKKMTIVATLPSSGQAAPFVYTPKPRYRAVQLAGKQGQALDAWVRSTDGGDAVAWLLDGKFRTLASNDDADDTTTDSHLTATLPHAGTYYIVLRDYSLSSGVHFYVPLTLTVPVSDAAKAAEQAWNDLAGTAGALASNQIQPAGLPVGAQAKYDTYAAKFGAQGAPPSAYSFAVGGDTVYAVADGLEETFWVDLFAADGSFLGHGYDGDGGPTIGAWDTYPTWDPSQQ